VARLVCIRYVFAVRGRMHAGSGRFLREFPSENARLLRKETASGPSRCFISFSCKYHVQLIKHSEIKTRINLFLAKSATHEIV